MKTSGLFLFVFSFFCIAFTKVYAERERFVEEDGKVIIEAENYHRHSRMGVFRHWYTLPDPNKTPSPNPDPFHEGSSGGMYLKALPYTRVTPDDTLLENLNFFETGEEAPRLEYDVLIQNPGRYYIWVRAYPTGTENASIHAGYDNIWPETGRAVQCCGSDGWIWSSNRRLDADPCGFRNGAYLDLPSGPVTIIFSMREDGFEFDKFILVNDQDYTPSGTGPAESSRINLCQDGLDNDGNGMVDCDDPGCQIYNNCRLPLKGRIAISSDGNGDDPDDIGASAAMFAILSSQNMQHMLVHQDYGNDIKGIYEPVWEEMQRTISEGIELFSLNPDVFFNVQTDFEAAVDNLRKEINKSSISDPLTIIHAGILSVISEAFNRSEPDSRKYVTVISHSWWNDYSHSTTYNDYNYTDLVGPVKDDITAMGVPWIQIMDQNTYLHTKRDGTPWYFLRDADDPKLNWVYERIIIARDIKYNKHDISDAGMLYYAITGDEEVTPLKLQEMLLPPALPPAERGVKACWAFNQSEGNITEDFSGNGNDLNLINIPAFSEGKYGQGLFLQENSQSYACIENELLSDNFPAASSEVLGDELTLTAWIKFSSMDNDDRCPIINKESEGNRGFTMDVRTPGYLHFQIAKDNNTVTKTGDFPGERTLILPDNWYHVAATYQYITDGYSLIKLYIDGETELTVSTARGPFQNNSSPLEIGAYKYNVNYQRYFMGLIDEVYIFNKVLSKAEIIELMNSESYFLHTHWPAESHGILKVYPNPAKLYINVDYEVTETGWIQLNIYNILGQVVSSLMSHHISIGRYTENIVVNGLPDGLYLVRLQAGERIETRRILIREI